MLQEYSFHQKEKNIWQNVKVCSCADTPHGAGHVCTRMRTCPVYFSTTRDNLPGHLAICVNNIIIMCIGLVHDIFTRNIYGVNINILVNDCADGTNLY